MTSQGLSGDLGAFPIVDTLHTLSRYRKSGPLILRIDSEEIKIRFDHGKIQSVTASDQSLRIGRILVAHGFVTEEQIEQALALQSATTHHDRIGDVLVDVGYVTPAQITRAVAAQLEAALARVLTYSEGTFNYIPEPPSSEWEGTGALDFEPLVMNATYLADQWMADQTPKNVDTLPEHLVDHEALERLSPSERGAMKELIDVYDQLHRLAWRVGLSARQFKQAVLRLLEQAMIRIAVENHEDQRISRRPNARYEQAYLVEETIDPWILDNAPVAAKDVLVEMLNGVTSVYELALRSSHGSDEFDHGILYLLDERLIQIEVPDDTASASQPGDIAIDDETFTLSDTEIPKTNLYELPPAARRTLIAMLNGERSLRGMAESSGLPMSLFREGANQLLERGLIAQIPE